jgi:hypothetical protein
MGVARPGVLKYAICSDNPTKPRKCGGAITLKKCCEGSGDVGGDIVNYQSLSQLGTCWPDPGTEIAGKSLLSGNAKLTSGSLLSGVAVTVTINQEGTEATLTSSGTGSSSPSYAYGEADISNSLIAGNTRISAGQIRGSRVVNDSSVYQPVGWVAPAIYSATIIKSNIVGRVTINGDPDTGEFIRGVTVVGAGTGAVELLNVSLDAGTSGSLRVQADPGGEVSLSSVVGIGVTGGSSSGGSNTGSGGIISTGANLPVSLSNVILKGSVYIHDHVTVSSSSGPWIFDPEAVTPTTIEKSELGNGVELVDVVKVTSSVFSGNVRLRGKFTVENVSLVTDVTMVLKRDEAFTLLPQHVSAFAGRMCAGGRASDGQNTTYPYTASYPRSTGPHGSIVGREPGTSLSQMPFSYDVFGGDTDGTEMPDVPFKIIVDGVDYYSDSLVSFDEWLRNIITASVPDGHGGTKPSSIEDPYLIISWQSLKRLQDAIALYKGGGSGTPDDPYMPPGDKTGLDALLSEGIISWDQYDVFVGTTSGGSDGSGGST